MEIVKSILILSILVIGQCRDLNHASGGQGPLPEESPRIEVCIDEYLGCFPETEPGVEQSTGDAIADWFENQFWRSSRATVGTEFRFWAPGKTDALVITNGNFHEHITEKSGYDTTLNAYFIIHGFHGGNAPWAVTMKDALMQREPCNVFIVDWSGGDGLLYGTAAANTWIVGAEVGRFIERVQIKTGLKLQKVHLIGHSLGAHAAGFAGKWLKNKLKNSVGRITGLDVAGPDYSDVVPAERLDIGDAEFVDVIHSNGAEDIITGLGIMKPIGHFDFYPNGGKLQPGCPSNIEAEGEFALETLEIISPVYKTVTLIVGDEDDIGDAIDDLACNHGRAIQFFIESINSDACRFVSDQCTSWEDYQAGKCPAGGLRVPMGYKAKKFRSEIDAKTPKKFYLSTNAQSPFCQKNSG